jgi:hypothetical protein
MYKQINEKVKKSVHIKENFGFRIIFSKKVTQTDDWFGILKPVI